MLLAPPLPPLPYTTSAVRSLWVRDNPVDPTADPRGTGFGAAAGEVLVELVRARRVTEVHLAAPEDGMHGPVGEWAASACRLLRSRRTYVSALGGELAWLEDAPAAALWTRDTLAAAPFHRVHLDLAPWAHPEWESRRAELWAGYLATLDAVRTAANGVPIDADVPWWFARDDGVELLDAVLDRAARVTVLVDATRTEGPTGILERVVPTARRCNARRAGFAIGVRAGTRDDGAPAFSEESTLEREAATVRATLRFSTGYRGFAVDDHRSWLALLEGSADAPAQHSAVEQH